MDHNPILPVFHCSVDLVWFPVVYGKGKPGSTTPSWPEAKSAVRFWVCFESRLAGFASGSDIGIKKDSEDFWPQWKPSGRTDLPFTETRMTIVEPRKGVAGREMRIKNLVLKILILSCPLDFKLDVSWIAGMQVENLRESSELRSKFGTF